MSSYTAGADVPAAARRGGDDPGPQGGGLGQTSMISGLDDLGEPKGWRPDRFVCFFSFPRAFLSKAGATFGPNLPFRGLRRVLMLVVSAVSKVRNVVPCALGRSLEEVELVPERVEPLWEQCSRDSCLCGLLLRRLVGDGSRSGDRERRSRYVASGSGEALFGLKGDGGM